MRIGAAPKKREVNIEKKVVDWARGMGYIVRKMNGLGNADWPDRMFINHNGLISFIEFKRPGNRPTDNQARMILQLGMRGIPACWADDADAAIEWLKGLEKK